MEEKVKILVIDDNKEIVNAVKQLLEVRGFIIQSAYGGKEGLELIKKEKPDIIILDIMMPDIDGRDVLIALKKSEETKNIPVIMLTAKIEQFERQYGMELGAYEYVPKPYESDVLLRHIKTIIDKKRKGELK